MKFIKIENHYIPSTFLHINYKHMRNNDQNLNCLNDLLSLYNHKYYQSDFCILHILINQNFLLENLLIIHIFQILRKKPIFTT